MIGALPAGQRRVLAALATYRLLNAGQMMRAGVADSEAAVRDATRALERKGLLEHSAAPLVSGVTRLPRLYWLTDRGAEILSTGNPEIDPLGARRKMGETMHIMHRIRTVDTHIALRRWAAAAGHVLDWFVTDFEPGSGGRRKPTTIEYCGKHGPRFTPDGLASVIGPDGHSRLLALEIERGRRDARRLSDFKNKLPQLREVSGQHVVEEWAGRPEYRARFLVVFASAELRDKSLTTWPDPDAPDWANFFVKCDDDLADFNGGWWRPGGRSQRPLFSWATSAQPTTAMPLPAA